MTDERSQFSRLAIDAASYTAAGEVLYEGQCISWQAPNWKVVPLTQDIVQQELYACCSTIPRAPDCLKLHAP